MLASLRKRIQEQNPNDYTLDNDMSESQMSYLQQISKYENK